MRHFEYGVGFAPLRVTLAPDSPRARVEFISPGGRRRGELSADVSSMFPPGASLFGTYAFLLCRAASTQGPLLCWVREGERWVRLPCFPSFVRERAALWLVAALTLFSLFVGAWAGEHRSAFGALLTLGVLGEAVHLADKLGAAKRQRAPVHRAALLATLSALGAVLAWPHVELSIVLGTSAIGALSLAFRLRHEEVVHIWSRVDEDSSPPEVARSARHSAELAIALSGGHLDQPRSPTTWRIADSELTFDPRPVDVE